MLYEPFLLHVFYVVIFGIQILLYSVCPLYACPYIIGCYLLCSYPFIVFIHSLGNGIITQPKSAFIHLLKYSLISKILCLYQSPFRQMP